MQDLKVTIIQTDLAWRNPDQNLSHFDNLISGLKENTDLIVLPEMFTTGFTVKPNTMAERHNGRTLNWMRGKASDHDCVVIGSYIIEEEEKFYNRLYVVYPNGRALMYDKKHLFRMAEEDKQFTPGTGKVIAKVKGWKISPLICYDLRFPVWSRNRFSNDQYEYDCLIYVANWPEIRSYAWKTLLVARAIENQSYAIGVNRIGTDGNGISHSGDSMVIDPWGAVLSKTAPHTESLETINISAEKLESFRKKVTFGMDWEKFEILE